jgi:hypothetical protein
MAKQVETADRNGKGHAVVLTTPEERATYGSVEEANEARPTRRPKWRLFTVTDPTGATRYTWCPYKELAVFRVALSDGYRVADPGRAPSKDKVAELLAAMSPEDRAALLAQYGGGRKGK